MITRVVDESRRERLRRLLQNLPQLGIRFYMIGTKEGLSVVSDATVDMPDADLLSAATATMLSTGDFLSDKYKEGVTNEIVMRVERGYILIFRVGADHNLAAVIGAVTNIDYYMDILRKYSKAVEEVVVPGEEVKEAEELLKKELEMIGVPSEGAGEATPATGKGQRQQTSRAAEAGERTSPPRGRKKKQ